MKRFIFTILLLLTLAGCAKFQPGWNTYVSPITQTAESFEAQNPNVQIVYFLEGGKWVQVTYGMMFNKGQQYKVLVGG